MNYEKLYNEIIENAIKLDRKKNQGIYLEEHHILPRCKNGTNDKSNLVMLTAREHFLCHKLLHKMFPEDSKLFFAFRAMSAFDVTGNRQIGSKEFEKTKELFAKFISLELTGRKLSEEHLKASRDGVRKYYETHSGNRLGIEKSKESIEKQKESLIEYWASRTPEEMKEWSEKFSGENNANFGKSRPDDVRQKISESHSLRIVYDGIEYLSTKVLCEGLGMTRSTLSKKFPKLNKEHPEKYYYIDPEGKRDKPRKKTQVNNKRIIFDGIEYESVAACSRIIGKSDVRVGQIIREQIKKNNPNYSYLT